jgi:hypothetical protein
MAKNEKELKRLKTFLEDKDLAFLDELAEINEGLAFLKEKLSKADFEKLEVLKGDKGEDGKTPKKYEDYFTAEELKEIIEIVTPKRGEHYFNDDDIIAFKEAVIPIKDVDYFDGKEGPMGPIGPQGPQGPAGANGADGSPDTPQEIVEKLESLDGEERLSAKAIKGLPAYIGQQIAGGGGGFRMDVLDEGVLIASNPSQMNFVGTGVTVTATANGVQVAIGGGGGGVGGSGTATQVAFWTTATDISGDNALWWDNTNKRLGIGTITPAEQLQITSNFRLPDASSTVGIIYSSTTKYIHSPTSASFFAGKLAGASVTFGDAATGVGYGALTSLTSGNGNTAVGNAAMAGMTTGNSNTAIGRQAMQLSTAADECVAIGYLALSDIGLSGLRNVAVGASSGLSLTSGSDNTFVGNGAGNPITSGGGNTLVGSNTGSNMSTSTNVTLIGNSAAISAATDPLDNATAIGASAVVGASNTIILGGTGASAVNVGINTTTASERLDVNGNITTRAQGAMIWQDAAGGQFVSFRAPAVVTSSETYNLPPADGTSGQVFTTDGSGNITWTTVSGSLAIGSTVTGGTTGSILFIGAASVLAQDNANLFYDDTNNRLGIGTTTPSDTLHVAGDATITGKLTVGGSIDPTDILIDAGGSNAAYLEMKAGQSAAVSPASSGRIRYNATTNKWQLSENGGAYADISTVTGAITSLNGLSASSQTFATGTAGTDFAIVSAVSTHTFNLPIASGTNTGKLSNTDWTTFNNKFTLPALTSGSVLFSNGTTIVQDNANFFWDDTNNRLGLGTAAPAQRLDVNGNITTRAQGALILQDTAGGQFVSLRAPSAVTTSVTYDLPPADGTSGQMLTTNGAGVMTWTTPPGASGVTGSGANGQVTFWTGTSTVSGESALFWNSASDRLGVGNSSPSFNLDVTGDARISSAGNAAFLQLDAGQSAAVSSASTGRIRYNATSQTFQISENGGAYTDLTTGGTVTSVNVSGGATGLTFSGGPITTSGTITMAGTLGVANGGTGSTSFTAGSVIFSNGTILTQDNANFFWDDTNNVLSVSATINTAPLIVSATPGSSTNGYFVISQNQNPNAVTNYAGYGIRIKNSTDTLFNAGGLVGRLVYRTAGSEDGQLDIRITRAGVSGGSAMTTFNSDGSVTIYRGTASVISPTYTSNLTLQDDTAGTLGGPGISLRQNEFSVNTFVGSLGHIVAQSAYVAGTFSKIETTKNTAGNNTDMSLVFAVPNSGGTLTDTLFVKGGGTTTMVGIGVSSPLAKIHIHQDTLGSAVSLLDSTASNDDPNETVYQNKVLTTNATATTIHTFAIPASTTVQIKAWVTARRTGGAAGTAEDGAGYEILGTFKNVAGTATQIGASNLVSQEDQALWTTTFSPSGANVNLQVTGATNNNVSWIMTARVYQIST